MSSFEFVFSLFGLLLGLSLAEVLSGFGKAVKARRRVHIGWLTPLLGLLVMLDLTSFWTSAWQLRDALPVKYIILMLMLLLTGIYYLAATLVFPENPDERPDYDAHFWENKNLVLGAMLVCNLPNYIIDYSVGRAYLSVPIMMMISTLFLSLLAVGLFLKGRVANIVLLAVLVALYPFAAIYGYNID
jgi:hypothetical protein